MQCQYCTVLLCKEGYVGEFLGIVEERDPLNADVASGGHATKDLATGQVEGLFFGHLNVLSSAEGFHRGAGSLGWGRGSGRGVFLGGLEEGHDCDGWFGLSESEFDCSVFELLVLLSEEGRPGTAARSSYLYLRPLVDSSTCQEEKTVEIPSEGGRVEDAKISWVFVHLTSYLGILGVFHSTLNNFSFFSAAQRLATSPLLLHGRFVRDHICFTTLTAKSEKEINISSPF